MGEISKTGFILRIFFFIEKKVTFYFLLEQKVAIRKVFLLRFYFSSLTTKLTIPKDFGTRLQQIHPPVCGSGLG